MRPSHLTDKDSQPIRVEAREPLGDPIGCGGREKKANERGFGGGVRSAIGCEAAEGGRGELKACLIRPPFWALR